jgi:hypothetical protein
LRRTSAYLATRPRLRFAIAAASVTWFLVLLWTLIGEGRVPFPGGDVTSIFDPAGDRLRAGEPVYAQPFNGAFFYGPPFAVLYGAISWLPGEVQQAIVLVGELAALRYLGGSWFGFCCALAFPLMPWELMSGHFNLVIAAGIVLAIRGDPRIAVGTAFAKLYPVVGMDPRDWRRAVPVVVVAVVITVPWLSLWPAWLGLLVEAYRTPGIGPQIPVPFLARAVVAGVLLLAWRPWSRAAAAVVVIPAFYFASFVLFIAPVVVILRGITPSVARPHPLARLGALVTPRS